MPKNELSERERFVRVLSPAIRQAAAIARALEGTVPNEPKAEATDVKSALTIADTAAQEAVLVPLFESFPDVSLEAEEDTETAALFGSDPGRLVVVDPIDGTLHSYLNARGPYATMVGLAVGGRYVASLVGLPREGIFLDAVRGGVARRARVRATPKPWRAESRGPRVLVHHAMPEAVTERLRAADYDIVHGCGGAISVAPLLKGFCGGLRLAPDTISIRGRIGLLIARAAGATVTDQEGACFPDDLSTTCASLVLSADEAHHEAFLRALSG